MSNEDNSNSSKRAVPEFANRIVTEAIKEGLNPEELLDSILTLLISLLMTARDKENVDIKKISVSAGIDVLTVTLEKIGGCNESNT